MADQLLSGACHNPDEWIEKRRDEKTVEAVNHICRHLDHRMNAVTFFSIGGYMSGDVLFWEWLTHLETVVGTAAAMLAIWQSFRT